MYWIFFENVSVKVMLTLTIFEILLFKSRSVLSPIQQGSGSETVNSSTVLYCFNPLNAKGVYIRSFKMLPSNKERMMSYTELSVQPHIKLQDCNKTIRLQFYQQPLQLLETNLLPLIGNNV